MSHLAFYESPYPLRRVAARYLALVENVALPARGAVSPQAQVKPSFLKDENPVLAVVAVVLALHVAVTFWLHRPVADAPYVPPEIPPMVVDLAPPPELPPPPPLKKELPPPPVQKQPARPEPQPVPEPVKTEAAPVEPPVEAPAPPPAPVAPPAPPVEKITEPDAYAGYLRNPAPAYPAFAQEQGWEGRVLLQVHVLASGKPDSVQLKKSSGRKLLDEAAVRTVQRWTFAPAKRGSTPVDGWVDVPIDFKLN